MAVYLGRQDLSTRFRGNLAGAAWLIVAPVLQLAVFYAVFVHIFQTRIPGLEGAGYLAFLALGFWPWFAFSEGITRATTSLSEQAALTAKVAVPRAAIVASRVMAAFVLHGAGFVVVLVLLPLMGIDLAWRTLPLIVLLWLCLAVFSLGLSLIAASLQVFLRDLGQMMPHLLQLLFFLSPILFVREMAPPVLRPLLDANPLTGLIGGVRSALLQGHVASSSLLSAVLVTLLVLVLGVLLFRRCERHFEDYL